MRCFEHFSPNHRYDSLPDKKKIVSRCAFQLITDHPGLHNAATGSMRLPPRLAFPVHETNVDLQQSTERDRMKLDFQTPLFCCVLGGEINGVWRGCFLHTSARCVRCAKAATCHPPRAAPAMQCQLDTTICALTQEPSSVFLWLQYEKKRRSADSVLCILQ